MYDTVIGNRPTNVHRSDESVAARTNSQTPLNLGPLEAPEIKRVGAHTEQPVMNAFQGIPGVDMSRFEDPVIQRATVPQLDGPTATNIKGLPDMPWNSMEAEVKKNMQLMAHELIEKPKEQAKIC